MRKTNNMKSSKPQPFRSQSVMGCMALAAMLTLAGCQTAPVQQIQPVRWTYDFNFIIEGDAMAKPTQAFTDGKSTYMTFRPTQPVGKITNSNGEELPVQEQGSYLVIDAILPEVRINLGDQYFAKVSYNLPPQMPAQIMLPAAAAVSPQTLPAERAPDVITQPQSAVAPAKSGATNK